MTFAPLNPTKALVDSLGVDAETVDDLSLGAGTRAAQPTAAAFGEGFYWVTDEGVVEHSDGAAWSTQSAMTLEGSSVTEQTMTGTTPTDLVTISGLSIPATKPLLIIVRGRATGSGADGLGIGLKLNSTVVEEAAADVSHFIGDVTGGVPRPGIAQLYVPPRDLANYLHAGHMIVGYSSNITLTTLDGAIQPSAVLTSVTIRGVMSGTSSTGAIQGVSVYSLTN